MDKYTCPECFGSGGKTETIILERTENSSRECVFIVCYYCAGTGFATDEDTFEEFHHEL